MLARAVEWLRCASPVSRVRADPTAASAARRSLCAWMAKRRFRNRTCLFENKRRTASGWTPFRCAASRRCCLIRSSWTPGFPMRLSISVTSGSGSPDCKDTQLGRKSSLPNSSFSTIAGAAYTVSRGRRGRTLGRWTIGTFYETRSTRMASPARCPPAHKGEPRAPGAAFRQGVSSRSGPHARAGSTRLRGLNEIMSTGAVPACRAEGGVGREEARGCVVPAPRRGLLGRRSSHEMSEPTCRVAQPLVFPTPP